MDEQLALGWKIVVDDVVQHRNVNASGREIGYDHNASDFVTKSRNTEFASHLIEGTVRIRTRDSGLTEDLQEKTVVICGWIKVENILIAK